MKARTEVKFRELSPLSQALGGVMLALGFLVLIAAIGALVWAAGWIWQQALGAWS